MIPDGPVAFECIRLSSVRLTRSRSGQKVVVGMPSRSSSSSRMMMRGVTISIRLVLTRPMPTLRKRRSIQRGLGEDRHAVLLPFLVEPLDAAQEDRAAVGDGDGRRDGGRG